MLDRFTDHPHAVGETYSEHAVHAGGFGLQLVAAGLACLTHAIFPWLFEDYASRKVKGLHATMTSRRAPLDLTNWVGDGLGV